VGHALTHQVELGGIGVRGRADRGVVLAWYYARMQAGKVVRMDHGLLHVTKGDILERPLSTKGLSDCGTILQWLREHSLEEGGMMGTPRPDLKQ
jgi:hypothetical protein